MYALHEDGMWEHYTFHLYILWRGTVANCWFLHSACTFSCKKCKKWTSIESSFLSDDVWHNFLLTHNNTCYKMLWLPQLYEHLSYNYFYFFLPYSYAFDIYYKMLKNIFSTLAFRMCVYELLQMWWRKWINTVKMALKKSVASLHLPPFLRLFVLHF